MTTQQRVLALAGGVLGGATAVAATVAGIAIGRAIEERTRRRNTTLIGKARRP